MCWGKRSERKESPRRSNVIKKSWIEYMSESNESKGNKGLNIIAKNRPDRLTK